MSFEDQDALDSASVHEECSAQSKGLRLCEKHGDDEPTGMSGFIPPARNQACFLLDEAAIDMLAEIR